jgi:hypothetical protein
MVARGPGLGRSFRGEMGSCRRGTRGFVLFGLELEMGSFGIFVFWAKVERAALAPLAAASSSETAC